MCTKLLVAAIDFGTTFSGYAFSFRHDFERETLEISTNTWVSGEQGLISLKTPTTILLTPDKKFHSFGYEAEEKYSYLAEEDDHDGWYYFRRFKMMLHNNPQLNRTTVLADVAGRELPAKIVFTMAIKYLKGHLMETLNNRIGLVEEKDIKWVLTVPAIWTDAAKQFMRECAQEANIEHDNLILALEPEVASLYCKTLPMDKLDCGAGRTLSFSPGTTYMVVDLGGGTVDVTIHGVKADGSLEEIEKGGGGPWGGTLVDSAFFQFLSKLFGNSVLNELKETNMSDYMEITKNFEIKKRTISATTSGKVRLGLPFSLIQLFENQTGKKLSDILPLTNFSHSVNVKKNKLEVDVEVFKGFFKESIENIIHHVLELLSTFAERVISPIILVGGYAESPMVVDTIRDMLPDTRIVIPNEPGLAVLKGAVLFGHKPEIIVSRVCKYTYGVEVHRLFIPDQHPSIHKHEENGVLYCQNVFDKFVHIGEHVASDAVIEKCYTPNKNDAVKGIGVFASTSPHPRFITDTTCFRLGTILLREPVGGWTKKSCILVRFQFGGPEFSVHITDCDSGSEYSGTYDFLR